MYRLKRPRKIRMLFDDESIPISRRYISTSNSLLNHSDHEDSPKIHRHDQSEISFNEKFDTPVELIALYEKTIEFTSKNKINAKNAFHFPLVERLPEIIDLIAFDEDDQQHIEPNFVKAGSVIDTSAKIYAYRVDALHSETQKLNGTIQQNENEIENESEVLIRTNQRAKMKASSYLAMDLSSISLSSEFQFHPCQPTNFCRWTGGIGCDSLFADMISYTMYSSSDFPLLNGYIDFDTQMTDKFDGNEQILDIGLLRNVIQDNEGYDHVLGCRDLREFSFNESSSESYIDTIDECSFMDVDEVRDYPTSSFFHEIQSAHTFPPTTIVSMDMALAPDPCSFVDHIPQLLNEKIDSSEYSYFDSNKLKLFAGPYLWKYTNLLSNSVQSSNIITYKSSRIRLKLNFFGEDLSKSLNDFMSIESWIRKSSKKHKRKLLPTILRKSHTNNHQLRLARKARPSNELSSLYYFPEFDSNIPLDYSFDCLPCEPDISLHYDFQPPIHYDRIEFDENFSKVNPKQIQIHLHEQFNHEFTSNPICLSNLCVKLIDQGLISAEKNQLVSAFYCMLNNCNKNHLYMRTNIEQDDLIIQKQPFN